MRGRAFAPPCSNSNRPYSAAPAATRGAWRNVSGCGGLRLATVLRQLAKGGPGQPAAGHTVYHDADHLPAILLPVKRR